ncbi:aspartate--tRNA ligase [Candidatus Babeliales bacterium]|nr:aspartate--tRNA ligase [Candidatus Babeliales bacterium]
MQLFQRSAYCGEVNESFLGKEIFLSGWVRNRRDHGGLIFIDLGDRTGTMQLVFNPDIDQKSLDLAHKLRHEFVISVRGKVINRSPETINEKLSTGKYELQVDNLSIVNKANPLPYQLEEAKNVDEELKLRYRYIDLRREEMQSILKLRHKVAFTAREYLDSQGFYEIETPILSKSTPEGARDFLVPSRLSPGTFYALPQSPQIYKQLLMGSGVDKYFQIVKCFRDEDLRANRQPEFTQIDIEMSFIQESDIQNICEGILSKIFDKVLKQPLDLPFPRITYDEAFSKFGTDAPDTRFSLEIKKATNLFKETELKFLRSIIDKDGEVGMIHVKEKEFTRSELDNLVDKAIKKFEAKGLLYVRFKEDGTPDSPVSKFLPEDFLKQVREIIPTLSTKDTLFFVAGKYKESWGVLAKLRLLLGKNLNLIDKNKFKFLWVTDFPLFEYNEDEKRWDSVHHPFTQPEKDWENLELKDVKSRAYDLVCNGQEIGGGSIRIHDSEMQSKIFDLLGISQKEAEEKFGFLLEAQQLGFPPHGGFAFGQDRFLMILSGSDSIRDVIAFPKTQSGTCPLMKTPSKVDDKQLKELQIKSTYVPEEE